MFYRSIGRVHGNAVRGVFADTAYAQVLVEMREIPAQGWKGARPQ